MFMLVVSLSQRKKRIINNSKITIMKTLDYLHLDESAAGKLVRSLQQLLADFQVRVP